MSEKDVLSYALYPKVFQDWQEHTAVYGQVGLRSVVV